MRQLSTQTLPATHYNVYILITLFYPHETG